MAVEALADSVWVIFICYNSATVYKIADTDLVTFSEATKDPNG